MWAKQFCVLSGRNNLLNQTCNLKVTGLSDPKLFHIIVLEIYIVFFGKFLNFFSIFYQASTDISKNTSILCWRFQPSNGYLIVGELDSILLFRKIPNVICSFTGKSIWIASFLQIVLYNFRSEIWFDNNKKEP